MPKGSGAKGTKLTLKAAKKAIQTNPDGRRRLVLRNMGLTIFPKCILSVQDLDELDLSRNLIEKLPDSIGSLTSLIWLDLHSNKLESLPESMGKLVGLEHLNVSNNMLTSAGLPSTLGSLTRLRSLNLGLNKLDTLPPSLEDLDSLQEFGLFDNLFKKLPDFVEELHGRIKVNIKRNPLTYAQGDGARKKKSEPKEDLYVVHESNLCRTCLNKCKAHGEKLVMAEGGGGDMFDRIRAFAGLITPNSVASANQDVWRIRKVEHEPMRID